jgi:hypothetical protein
MPIAVQSAGETHGADILSGEMAAHEAEVHRRRTSDMESAQMGRMSMIELRSRRPMSTHCLARGTKAAKRLRTA